jgi:hypothetical protein
MSKVFVVYERNDDPSAVLVLQKLLYLLSHIKGKVTLCLETPPKTVFEDIRKTWLDRQREIKALKDILDSKNDEKIKWAFDTIVKKGLLEVHRSNFSPEEIATSLESYNSVQENERDCIDETLTLIKSATKKGVEVVGIDLPFKERHGSDPFHMEQRDKHMYEKLLQLSKIEGGVIIYLVGLGHANVTEVLKTKGVAVEEFYPHKPESLLYNESLPIPKDCTSMPVGADKHGYLNLEKIRSYAAQILKSIESADVHGSNPSERACREGKPSAMDEDSKEDDADTHARVIEHRATSRNEATRETKVIFVYKEEAVDESAALVTQALLEQLLQTGERDVTLCLYTRPETRPEDIRKNIQKYGLEIKEYRQELKDIMKSRDFEKCRENYNLLVENGKIAAINQEMTDRDIRAALKVYRSSSAKKYKCLRDEDILVANAQKMGIKVVGLDIDLPSDQRQGPDPDDMYPKDNLTRKKLVKLSEKGGVIVYLTERSHAKVATALKKAGVDVSEFFPHREILEPDRRGIDKDCTSLPVGVDQHGNLKPETIGAYVAEILNSIKKPGVDPHGSHHPDSAKAAAVVSGKEKDSKKDKPLKKAGQEVKPSAADRESKKDSLLEDVWKKVKPSASDGGSKEDDGEPVQVRKNPAASSDETAKEREIIFVYNPPGGDSSAALVLKTLLPRIQGKVTLCMESPPGNVYKFIREQEQLLNERRNAAIQDLETGKFKVWKKSLTKLVEEGHLAVMNRKMKQGDLQESLEAFKWNSGEQVKTLGEIMELISLVKENGIEVIGIDLPFEQRHPRNADPHCVKARNKHMVKELLQLKEQAGGVIVCLVGPSHADVAQSLGKVEGLKVTQFFPHLVTLKFHPEFKMPNNCTSMPVDLSPGDELNPKKIGAYAAEILKSIKKPGVDPHGSHHQDGAKAAAVVSGQKKDSQKDKPLKKAGQEVKPSAAEQDGSGAADGDIPRAFFNEHGAMLPALLVGTGATGSPVDPADAIQLDGAVLILGKL